MRTAEQHAQAARDDRYLRGTIIHSPGRQAEAEGPPLPLAVRKAVGVEPVIVVLRDGTQYRLYTTGEFRLIGGGYTGWRPVGLSGRQRRIRRKIVNRARFKPVGTAHATAVVNQ